MLLPVLLAFCCKSTVCTQAAPAPVRRPAIEAAARIQRRPSGDVLVLETAGLDGIVVDAKDAGLAAALRLVESRVDELQSNLGIEMPLVFQFAPRWLSQPLRLSIGTSERGTPSFELAVRWPDAELARAEAARLGELLVGGGFELRANGESTDHLVGQTPFGPLHMVLDEGAESVALTVALGRAPTPFDSFANVALPDGHTPALHLRFDGRGIPELLERLGAPVPEESLVLFAALGLIGPEAGPISVTVSHGADVSLSEHRVEGWTAAARRSGLFVAESLPAAAFRAVPADATWVALWQTRPSALLNWIDGLQPGAAVQTSEAVRGLCGVDLKADLLAHLGPTIGAYAARSTGGGGLASIVLSVSTDDADSVVEASGRIWHALRAMAGRELGGRLALRTWEHGEVECATIVFPGLPIPLELSLAATPDRVLAAVGPGALTGALNQLEREDSILDRPMLARRPEGQEGLAGFAFLDVPFYVERGYGPATLLSAALANAVRSPRDVRAEPGRLLPSCGELAAGARPWIARTRVGGRDLITTTTFDRSWIVNGTALVGTPAGQFYQAAMPLGIVSAIAIPKLLVARSSANEAAAIATLRALTSGQAQFQASAAVDVDGDGMGEYGFVGELAGVRPLRTAGPQGPVWGSEVISPRILGSTFADLQADANGAAVVQRSGYYFQVWLPGPRGYGIAEPPGPTSGRASTDTQAGETRWCAYAWPVQLGSSGLRAFYTDERGDLLATGGGRYQGLGAGQPRFDAALAVPGSLAAHPNPGRPAADGGVWVFVN